jgi:hypothetical protein
MNNYHRYLNLPFEIAKPDICNTIPDTPVHKDINTYVDEQMLDFLKGLGLRINHTEVFYTAPNTSLPIHCDHTLIDNRVKINVTWGPEEGVIRWWKAKKFDILTSEAEYFSERPHNNVIAQMEDCDMVYQANTNRPSLVNVGQLHDTYSPSTAGRWTLCFVPALEHVSGDSMQWDQAMEYFGDYIE